MANVEKAPVARVPAWKRLGLKLSRQDESKKRKLEDTSPQTQSESALKRKKSVTFAETVKEDDGSHTDKIVNNFIKEQRGGPDQFTPREVSKFSVSSTHPANGGSSKTLQTAQSTNNKPSTKSKSKTDADSANRPEYLNYLIQFCTDKENWKFRKHDQTLLLKYTFSERRIPSEYFDYYLKYIDGLQGQARARLAQRAQAAVDEPDFEDGISEEETEPRNKTKEPKMEDPRSRKDARDAAMKKQLLDTKLRLRELADDDALDSQEFRMKYSKRKRGEEILRLLADESATLGMPNHDQANASVAPSNQVINSRAVANPGQFKRVRIRKARTGLPEDDLSSVSSVELDEDSSQVKTSKIVIKKVHESSASDSSDDSSSESESSSESSSADSDSDAPSSDSSSSSESEDENDKLYFRS